MQNKTLMLMAIALKRGEGFVTETVQKREWVSRTAPGGTYQARWRKVVEKTIVVKPRAASGTLALIDDSVYDTASWSIAAKVHEHWRRRRLLLVTLIPEYGYNQFCNDAAAACAQANVPIVRVRPNLTHDAAREYFDFAIWQTVRDASTAREVELDMNNILQTANERAKEREVYRLFFGLKWPSIMRAAPEDLSDLTSHITRKRLEGNKEKLPEYKAERAAEVGMVTPFWMVRKS